MRRIGDCAVVRSTTDGHDAHITYGNIAYSNSSEDNGDIAYSNNSEDNCDFAYCDFAYCDFAYSNIAYSNIAYSNIAYSNIAGVGRCFCVPRRLV